MTKLLKKSLLVIVALAILATSLMVPGTLVSAAVAKANLSKSSSTGSSAPIKEKFSFNDGWVFKKAARNTFSGEGTGLNDSSWESVTLPHTWWKTGDGETKETDTNEGWYRKHVVINNNMKDGQIWIEFEAAAHYTEVYVNGSLVRDSSGTATSLHYGGYTTFRFNITPNVKFGQENVIAVRTDSFHNYTPPIGGGFSKFPGITGDVSLIYTESIFAALDDYGSPGVFVTPEVKDKQKNTWNVSVESTITNLSAAKNVKVKTVIRDMKTFEKVDGISESFTPFDESTMYGNKVYKTVEKTVSLKKGDNNFSIDIDFNNPRLWNGREDPYRYALDFEIWADGKLVDKVTQNFGFRYFEITKEGGFFLNGKSYPLRGVAYHEDYTDAGSAMTDDEWEKSFKLIYELGGTFSRLSHYPHDPISYELCDRYGIIVWTEIAIISGISTSGNMVYPVFEERAKDQLRELIRQNKNRPSIVVWGLENELDVGTNESIVADTTRFMNELHDIAKEEDPTRLTTQTAGLHHNWAKWEVDVTAFNFYPMWYGEGNFEAEYQNHRNRMDKVEHFKDTALGFVEYGAGAGTFANQHSEYPERPEKTTVKFHPAEWQNIVHEEAIKMINNHPELWVASLWCMFDFACDPFNEGDYAGTNDKGLVTRDRKTKKDTYYLYQANWLDSDTLPVLHIASSSMTGREVSSNTVKVYSNLDTVELFRDGKSLGKKTNDGNGIFVWENVSFGNIGESHTFVAKSGNKSTSVQWKRVASENVEFDINREQTYVDETNATIAFSGNIAISDINSIFISKYNANFKVVKADGITTVTSGNVEDGMKLVITSESGKTKKEYVLLSSNIAAGKTITASSHFGAKSPDKALDGYIDDLHQWNANESDNGRSWVLVDLGKTYTLSGATLHLFKGHNNNRNYYYNIYVGTTESNLEKVVDRTNNKQVGTITDSLGDVKGRYVKIEFTGNSDYAGGNKSAVAGLYELEINGYNIIEGEVKFDHENKTVTIPYTWDQNTNLPKLLNDVKIEGNAYITVEAGQFYVMNGDKLIINDFSGGKREYMILLGKDPNSKCSILLPENQVGYTLTANPKEVKYGGSSELKFELKDGYYKGMDFVVKVNGQRAKFTGGVCKLENITNDMIVAVEGVEKVGGNEEDTNDFDDTTSTNNDTNINNTSSKDSYTDDDNDYDGDNDYGDNENNDNEDDEHVDEDEPGDNDNADDDEDEPEEDGSTDSEDDEEKEPADSQDGDSQSANNEDLIVLLVAIGAVLIVCGAGATVLYFYLKMKKNAE